jgi:proline iminopeptidase
MKTYPEIKPYESFMMKVDNTHNLYVEVSGNPKGIPVLFLHGGPGAGTSPLYRRYFNPSIYKIILFDQRGSGKSTPYGCIENNTSQDLVQDIKKILDKLHISKVIIYGGSWGSTLALLFSESYPNLVHSLVLRGIFLCRKDDIQWFYQKGADSIFPEYWKDFIEGISDSEQDNILETFYKKIHSNDEKLSLEFCHKWALWEGRCSSLLPTQNVVEQFVNRAISLSKIETHYFFNNCFMQENQILKDIDKIQNIKSYIVHGRYDIVCPFKQAFDLYEEHKNSEIYIINNAGHSLLESGITNKILEIFNSPNELLS